MGFLGSHQRPEAIRIRINNRPEYKCHRSMQQSWVKHKHPFLIVPDKHEETGIGSGTVVADLPEVVGAPTRTAMRI